MPVWLGLTAYQLKRYTKAFLGLFRNTKTLKTTASTQTASEKNWITLPHNPLCFADASSSSTLAIYYLYIEIYIHFYANEILYLRTYIYIIAISHISPSICYMLVPKKILPAPLHRSARNSSSVASAPPASPSVPTRSGDEEAAWRARSEASRAILAAILWWWLRNNWGSPSHHGCLDSYIYIYVYIYIYNYIIILLYYYIIILLYYYIIILYI